MLTGKAVAWVFMVTFKGFEAKSRPKRHDNGPFPAPRHLDRLRTRQGPAARSARGPAGAGAHALAALRGHLRGGGAGRRLRGHRGGAAALGPRTDLRRHRRAAAGGAASLARPHALLPRLPFEVM